MKSNFAVDGRTHAEYRKTKSEMQDWLVAQKIMQENLKEDEQKKSSCMSRKCGRKKKIDKAVDVRCSVGVMLMLHRAFFFENDFL